MTGTQEFNKKYINKINNILSKQPDYIRGFVNYSQIILEDL